MRSESERAESSSLERVDCVLHFFYECFSVQLTCSGRCLSKLHSKEAERVRDFHVGNGDVFLFELPPRSQS